MFFSTTVDSIVKRLTKVVAQLEAHHVTSTESAKVHAAMRDQHDKHVFHHQDEAERALRIRDKIKELVA